MASWPACAPPWVSAKEAISPWVYVTNPSSSLSSFVVFLVMLCVKSLQEFGIDPAGRAIKNRRQKKPTKVQLWLALSRNPPHGGRGFSRVAKASLLNGVRCPVDGFITQETAPCWTRGSSQPGKQKARKWTHNPRTSFPDQLRCARERAMEWSHPISSCRQGLYWPPQELRLKQGNFSKLRS